MTPIPLSPEYPETDPDIQPILATAHFLSDHAASLSFEDFYNALKCVIGCDEDYARYTFLRFQDNPAAFLASRNPQSQSVEIIRAMMKTRSSI